MPPFLNTSSSCGAQLKVSIRTTLPLTLIGWGGYEIMMMMMMIIIIIIINYYYYYYYSSLLGRARIGSIKSPLYEKLKPNFIHFLHKKKSKLKIPSHAKKKGT
jgi:hypothetical protein